MSKSIQQIQQELTATEAAVTDLRGELEAAYQEYLDLLSKTVKKQLLLSSYYLCTQIYPESFLNLSFDRREKVQQVLRQIGLVINVLFYQYILEIFRLSRSTNTPQTSESKPPISQNLPNLQSSPSDDLQEPTSSENDTPKVDSVEKISNLHPEDRVNLQKDPDIVKVNAKNNNINSLVSIATLIDDNSPETLNNLQQTFQEKLDLINNPEDLLRCHKQIEQGINKSLENLNLEVNKRLQQAGIIPQKVPPQLLEIPIHSGDAGIPVNGLPHLLELTIEMGNSNSQDSENKTIAKIILLRLKVSELEFIDFNLGKERDRIRTLISEIDRLRHFYLKLKKEYLIVRAEAAWRSSWYEN
jgi:hypothetical protein